MPRYRSVSASAFFFSNRCPRCAPASRDLITASVVTVGVTFNRAPALDMTAIE